MNNTSVEKVLVLSALAHLSIPTSKESERISLRKGINNEETNGGTRINDARFLRIRGTDRDYCDLSGRKGRYWASAK